MNLANFPQLIDVQQAGLDCIELAWRQKNLDIFDSESKSKCDDVIETARKLNIDIWSLHIPYGTAWDPSILDAQARRDALERIVNVMNIASEWGIRTAVLHPSWEPIPNEERQQRLETCKNSLNELADQADALNVKLAIECLPRTCLGNSSGEMEYLISGHPNLGICCDVNHLLMERPEDFIQKLGERIVTTHISDYDGIDEKHWMPGKGINDWPKIIGALLDAGYNGAFIYEVTQSTPQEAADNWQQLSEQFIHAQHHA